MRRLLRNPQRLLPWLIGLYGVAACVGGLSFRPEDAPPQGWWRERGPVVPHDTFPSDCTLCHEPGDWHTIRQDFTFDHEKETGVELRGAHARAECLRCHNDRGPVALFAQRGCVGCHEDFHQGQLGTDCSTCHREEDWRPDGALAQHAKTRLPLVGAHAALACWSCHQEADSGIFRGQSPECAACHLADYQNTSNPDHATSNFPLTCGDCHGFMSWNSVTTFTHAGISSGCVECHLPEYQGTTDPNHAAEGFPTSCEQCHGTNRWNGAQFSHAGITNGCVECHLPEYQGTTDPNHGAQGFPTDCEQCHHNFTTWNGAQFTHAGITNGCVECHLPDYQGASDPNHVSAGFPTSCEQCHHTFTTWNGATFSHSGITQNCAQCHLSDWQTATDPNHQAAGFSTSCEDCHDSTSTWQGARYDDHQFPIYSGAHRNFACTQCHLSSNSFGTFSCTHCHEHRQSSMDDEHRGVGGYQWLSSRCYDCHPNGRH